MPGLQDLREHFEQVRSLEHWGLPEFSYASVAAFEATRALEGGIHSVMAAGWPIDLYVDIKPGCPVVFFFNGAKIRTDDLKLPFFAGLRVLPPGEVSRIYINDPSLYLEKTLSLGWYAGSRHLRLQEVLPRIIQHTIAVAHPGKVMFTGGSGGGFASLYYARLFPDSLAVVWNPQTNILRFYSEHIQDYGKAAFGLQSLASTEALLPNLVETDLCSLYASAAQQHYVLYLQNRSDDFHVRHHLIPFLADIVPACGEEPEFRSGMVRHGLYVHAAQWGEGHVTPAREFLTSLYENLLGYPHGWRALFADGLQLTDAIARSELADASSCT